MEAPLTNTVVFALGWTLIHFLWQGMVIAGAFWGISILARPGRANLRYWSGLVCMLAALAIPLITFFIYLERGMAPAIAAGPAISHVAVGAEPSIWMGLAAGVEPVLPIVVGLWAVGVLLLSMRTAVGWWGTRRLVREGAVPVDHAWRQRTLELIEEIGVRRFVRVLQSTRVTVPTVIGWIKPVILMPVSVMARLPAEQIEMVIAHELGHIRRNDYLFNFLQIVVETLLFYHPAVRWMSQRIREDRELCCDDLVVSHRGRPVLYARALASLEEVRSTVPMGAVAATGGDLFHRVRRIVETDLRRNGTALLQVAMVLLLAAMTTAGAHPARDEIRSLGESRLAWVQITPHIVPGEPVPIAQGALAHGAIRLAQADVAEQGQVEPVVETKPRITATRQDAAPAPTTTRGTPVAVPAVHVEQTPAYEVQLLAGKPLLDGRAILPPVTSPVASGANSEAEAVERLEAANLRPVETVSPRYPLRARAQDIEGSVRVTFSVNRFGRVRDVRVVESYPEGTFDSAAIHAIKRWKFARQSDRNEGRRLSQEFDFNLNDPAPMRHASTTCGRTGSRVCNSFTHNMHVLYVNPPKLPKLED